MACTVKLGKLTENLVTVRLSKPVSLATLLEKKGLSYDSSVRVNGKVVSQGTMLKSGDIITLIPSVEGGI